MGGIDTSRVPSGERATKSLIDAVMAGDDRLERHYLEVKSSLDLTTKKDQAKLAKFILGAANRMPDKASVAFEGYAVMVVGVEGGAIVGVPPIEVLAIERAVSPFIGADGPKWDIIRVQVEDTTNDVLLLLVAPPTWGQPPFVCQKDGDEKLRDGAVFIRADGETREAKGGELKELLRRGRVAAPAEAHFDVRIVGLVRPYNLDAQLTLEEYISTTRRSLDDALRLAQQQEAARNASPGPQSGRLSSLAQGRAQESINLLLKSMIKPESRSVEQYESSIDEWEARTRAAWGVGVMRLLGGLLEEHQIEVTNGEKTYFSGVEVEVHLEGKVYGTSASEAVGDAELGDLGFPAPPRKWGPTQVSPFGSSLLAPYVGNSYLPGQHAKRAPRALWRNSGSVDLSFKVGEMRPRATKTSTDLNVVLYSADQKLECIRGTWQITAEGHNEIYSGELNLAVGEPVDLTAELRKLMELD